ncbi:unnamed protein product [Rotaria sordida]|uniref:Uncharacterized protein n=1 Tax=Rotaria sordida TaxID=392033 RepID=A0A815L7J5_9BILA|nr:unnamed protein product [Rotaria sordida]
MKDDQNIWSHVRQIFKSYSPAFRGLKTPNGVVKNNQEIADQLANCYEKHFAEPTSDINGRTIHVRGSFLQDIIQLPSCQPLDSISINQKQINKNRKLQDDVNGYH